MRSAGGRSGGGGDGDGAVWCARKVDDVEDWSMKVVRDGECVNGFLSKSTFELRGRNADPKNPGRWLAKNGFVAGIEAHI